VRELFVVRERADQLENEGNVRFGCGSDPQFRDCDKSMRRVRANAAASKCQDRR
jgi:hypothetical protein